jgi:hypothetical protein
VSVGVFSRDLLMFIFTQLLSALNMVSHQKQYVCAGEYECAWEGKQGGGQLAGKMGACLVCCLGNLLWVRKRLMVQFKH